MSSNLNSSTESRLIGGKILVVDQDPFLTELVHYHFNRWGFVVDSCSSVDEWYGIDAGDYSLIIVDVAIDSNSGTQIVENISQNPSTREIPVLVCTSAHDTTGIVTALNAGATDYITRPFSINDFVSRIKTLLNID